MAFPDRDGVRAGRERARRGRGGADLRGQGTAADEPADRTRGFDRDGAGVGARSGRRRAETLARRYWPGPLTLVVPKRPAIPDIVTAGLPTVGLRMPAHPLALELIRAAASRSPLRAPIALRSSRRPPPEHVPERLADAVLEGGPSAVGIESTVLSLAGEPALLRPGVIALPEIEALIGPVRVVAWMEGAHASPGMHERHYSPSTPLYVLGPGEALPAGRGTVLRMPEDPLGVCGGAVCGAASRRTARVGSGSRWSGLPTPRRGLGYWIG